MAVLHPEVVFRVDAGGRGPHARAAGQRRRGGRAPGARARHAVRALARPAIVNGRAGALVAPGDTAMAVAGFTIVGGRIVAIDLIVDRKKLQRLSLEL